MTRNKTDWYLKNDFWVLFFIRLFQLEWNIEYEPGKKKNVCEKKWLEFF